MDETSNGLSEEAAEAALLATLSPSDDDGSHEDHDEGDLDETDGDYEEYEPSHEDQDGEEASEGDDEGEEAPEGDEDGEEGEEAPEGDAPAINDDHELTLNVNGEDQKVKLGALKALYGQRDSMERKSQDADLVGARAAAALQAAIEVVGEDLQPYSTVDWLVLQGKMDPETFQWHRENAQRLNTKYQKLVGAAQGVEQSFTQRRQNIDRDAAQSALVELKADVPEWSEQLYGDILKYGAEQGLDADDLATITNPKVIKLLRKAMLHDAAGKVATKKVKAAPAKVIKGSKTASPAGKQINAQKAMKRLAQTGADDAAVAALMGRWG